MENELIIDKCSYRYGRDTTFRLSFRSGDMLLHIGYNDIFSQNPTIFDVWELSGREFVTFTNRVDDLPEWFQLHPTEVCNSVAYSLLDKFNRGEFPPEPLKGPNLWRVKSGDYVVWLGESRSDIKSYDGILMIYSFSSCSLVLGESPFSSIEDYVSFGALSSNNDYRVRLEHTRRVLNIIKSIGIPREFAMDWSLG